MVVDIQSHKIDGLEYANNINIILRNIVNSITKKYQFVPKIAIIMVGNNTASELYVKNKKITASNIGITAQVVELPANINEANLLQIINDLNTNPDIHGIIVQLPLPEHLSANKMLSIIAPEKDLDGLTISNIGLLHASKKVPYTIEQVLEYFINISNNTQESLQLNDRLYKTISQLGITVPFIPCTPLGCLYLIEQTLKKKNNTLIGKNVAILGNSNLVSKPMARLLLQSGASTTTLHSQSQHYDYILQNADIIISATGKKQELNKIKKESIIIDIGIRRDMQTSRIIVDLNYDQFVKSNYITPVPKGVGPMTVASLMLNSVLASIKQLQKKI